MPRVAIISFPGTNNEVESVRSIKRAGMVPVCFKWNDDPSILSSCDAFFLVGGFSYEDRGRSGMVAARDPVMEVLKQEAAKGKPVIGHCNGAQIVVESGLIPLGQGLQMSLARNAISTKGGAVSPGFINEWITIKRVCKRDRCATSDWDGMLHIPIAHGEGRFTTTDPSLIEALKKSDQIAFQYCDERGTVSEDPDITPNGSMLAIAGICNPAGNVVALMPHPERSQGADMYFASLKRWITSHRPVSTSTVTSVPDEPLTLQNRERPATEIFIETIITNTEERTVEQAARRLYPTLTLKQFRYLAPTLPPEQVLAQLTQFNPNKEVAYVSRAGVTEKWDARKKKYVPLKHNLFRGTALLRCDIPETASAALGRGSTSGVCYDISGVSSQELFTRNMLEVFHNPHASTLQILAGA